LGWAGHQAGHTEAVRTFAGCCADVNGRMANGNTPAIIAARSGHPDTLLELSKLGAEIYASPPGGDDKAKERKEGAGDWQAQAGGGGATNDEAKDSDCIRWEGDGCGWRRGGDKVAQQRREQLHERLGK
jgi:hypothetical protein